jgi:hypothetical protein
MQRSEMSISSQLVVRRPISLTALAVPHQQESFVFVICDDGTMWEKDLEMKTWVRLPDIPQTP